MDTFPNGYRAFRPNELVRTGTLHDAWSRNGYVWARPVTGWEYTRALLNKAFKKLTELDFAVRKAIARNGEKHADDETRKAVTAQCRTAVLEELADVAEVFSRFEVLTSQADFLKNGIAPIAPPKPDAFRPLTLERALTEVCEATFIAEKKAATVYSAELATEPMKKHLTALNIMLGKLEATFGPGSYSTADIVAAMETRRREKGPLQNWWLEAIALPENDPWVEAFQRKHDATHWGLNPAEALQPEALAA